MALTKQQDNRRTLWYILLAALLVRLALAYLTDGYTYDMSCFVAWGDKMASEGAAAFYSEGYFADYPPGYILVLGLIGLIRKTFSIPYEAPLTYLLLALVPSLCDCAATALVWLVGEKSIGRGPTLTRVTLFVAFCPLLLYDTGVWKQIDGAFALPLILCFLLLEGKRYLQAALLYGVALAIKPQALLAGPVLAVCFLAGLADAARQTGGKTDSKTIWRATGRIFGGAALALAPPLLAGLPFYGLQGLAGSLLEKYVGTTASYPYATINAFNWFAALGGNWQNWDQLLLDLISWKTLGTVNILLITAALAVLAIKSWRAGRFSPLLLSAFYTVGIFTFAHCMHERYLVAGVLLVLLAAVRWGDIRLYGAGFGLSLTGFVNLATVYSLVGGDDEWLSSDKSQIFAAATGFVETVCFLLLAFAVYDLVFHGHRSALVRADDVLLPASPLNEQGTPAPKKKKQPGQKQAMGSAFSAPALVAAPAAQPRWGKRELLALLGLTVAAAVLSFTYLGEMTAPQTPLDATDTTLTTSFTVEGTAVELWNYPGISTGGNLSISDGAGNVLYTKELDYRTCWSWTKTTFAAAPGQTLTATLTNAQVFELALRDADGALVPVTGGEGLFDEQQLVPEGISQLNSMYFDEIYHGRTGYEMLNKLTVFETTHPPLGKDLIMLGIALFGMTGFGWRFSGALFGVLLVPLAWCFARRLTRKPWLGALAGALLALDFMRFAQSRISTIDVYGTFFILLGAYCMVWYCQSVLQKGVCASTLPMALGGVAFGLGCAAKWTGIYAGVGLAVLYLGVLAVRYRQKQPDFGKEFRTAAFGGVAFYVITPLVIYIASYLPYWWKNPGFTLRDWWDCQTYMLWYHSTLEATHAFSSHWYTWLLDLRPVWYYSNSDLPSGIKASIAGFGGPVIWLVGLFCILLLLWRQISGRGSRPGVAVLVLYGAQLAPWMAVSRCTFLYHYFPSSMFCLAAIAVVLGQMKDETRAKKIAVGLGVAALVLFVWFYPILSGLPVPEAWAYSLKVLPSYGFY